MIGADSADLASGTSPASIAQARAANLARLPEGSPQEITTEAKYVLLGPQPVFYGIGH